MKRAWVYVLKCQNNSWYVGQTTALQVRICEHFAGSGAQWTTLNRPVSVVEAIECPDGSGLALEAAKTAEYCMKYGWRKVRGSSFTRPDAPGPPAWYDETGERRKRAAKTKGSDVSGREQLEEDDQRTAGALQGPADPDGKPDALLCGVDAEWEASDVPSSPREMAKSFTGMDYSGISTD